MLRRPKPYNRKQPCYYCGAPSTSREHAPPEMLFRHLARHSSITVPSCDQHNSEKGGRDTAVVAALLSAIEQGAARGLITRPLPLTVQRAIARLHPTFNRAKNSVSLRPLIIDPEPGLDVEFPYSKPGVDLRGWAVSLSAALVWSATGFWDPHSDWANAWRWSPCYFPVASPISLEEVTQRVVDNLDLHAIVQAETDWWRGWSAHPYQYPEEIFRFELSFRNGIVIRHTFFDSLRIYVSFVTSSRTLEVLREAVGVNEEAPDQGT